MTCLFVYFSADVRAQLILREVTTTSFSATKERKTRRLSFPAKMKLKIVKNQLMTKKKWKVNVELWKTWMKIVKENEEKPFGVSSSIEVKWRFWRRFYSFLDQVSYNTSRTMMVLFANSNLVDRHKLRGEAFDFILGGAVWKITKQLAHKNNKLY